jgi:hypothetical protein
MVKNLFMKILLLSVGFLCLLSCTKTETKKDSSQNLEETIKFTTNLDTGIYNVADTLPLLINVSSKIPAAGIIYSITTIWTDSSMQVYKLDTSLSISNLNLNIPGLKKSGNYSISISVTSKSNATNNSNKNITVINNFLGRFMGYKVAANAKQIGTEYWENTPVLSDLMIGVFQKNYEVFALPQGDAYCAWTQAICNGDFNNDGYIDVFNAGSAFGGQKSRLSFLIWNSTTKIFDEKNLINNKTNFIGAPTKVSPIYLNEDNYVDLVIFGHQDESSPKNRIEPITVCLSDGKGGYDLTELVLQPPLPNEAVVYEHGSVEDLNGDKIPDLLIMANPRVYIFWGISTFPYFTNKDFIVSQRNDLPFYCKIKDINKDGVNDVMIGTNIENQLFINDGKGKVLTNKITVPYPTTSTNSMNVFDYIVDDINEDGLNDFINISATNHLDWAIDTYIHQKDGSFIRDISWIEYASGTKKGNYRNKLIYYDFDGDGKKDITYSDTGMDPYTSPTNEIKNKTVFIRSGNKFIEKDFFQFDPYAKSLKVKYFK